MDDLGDPVAHLALPEGVPVYDRDGERVGVVDRVMTDEATGIFEGLIIHTRPVVPGRHLYAGYDQIAELRERGVRLSVGRDELYDLHEHAGRRRPDDGSPESPIEAALRKAWDWISGVR
jgi:sporulation protein YlmC with PRC-barrel domain